MEYTIRSICLIIDGVFLQSRSDDTVQHLLLDSRRLIFPASSLFFSLKGPRRDGSAFLKELYRQGVRNFVVQGETEIGPDANVILVDDSLAAVQRLAAHHRGLFNIPVIGITGSNGKTIVKEWLNQLLEDRYHIVRSPKSYNSQIGVPLSVWAMQASDELGIFEAGISLPGEMSHLQKIILPTIGIFTHFGEAHGENFESPEGKIIEKIVLFKKASVVIYPADDLEVSKALLLWKDAHEQVTGQNLFAIFSWGRSVYATVRIREIVRLNDNTSIDIVYKDVSFSVVIPFTDVASVENAMSCICVLLYLSFSPADIAKRLLRLSPIAMRLELKSGINHCSVINDSYSADLDSLLIALDFLSLQRQHARRTVILSDFLQSGMEEKVLYGRIALALEQKKVDRLVGIGGRISANEDAVGQAYTGEVVLYPSVAEFKSDLFQLHFRDEAILLKGARVFEFEEIDRMLSEQIHQTVLEINLNAMAQNLRAYRQRLQPGTRVMAMVKAHAYGTGSYEIANLLQFQGVDYLGVAYADEGVVLRKAGIRMPIMVMNTENSSFDLLVQYNLQPVIYSFTLLHSFDRWLKKEGVLTFPVHIELETGMNRLGFPLQELAALAPALLQSAFTVQSVFSHLAASEEPQQDAYTLRQAELYLSAAAVLQEALPYPFLRHIANSAAIVRHPGLQLDMVRLGIGLYGIDSACSHVLNLQEVSTLKSTIAQIKRLEEGETIGYNRRGVAGPGSVIATVRIGYADGYPRSLGNGNGKMWLKGRLAPVIGSVCMDMTMIDITGIPDVTDGDEVIVFGNELSVSQLAHWAQTIPYEILTGVSQRVRRVYFEE